MNIFKWRRALVEQAAPVITPEQQAALLADAEKKLEEAKAMRESVIQVTKPLDRRNKINHYAHGIAKAYGVDL